MKNVKRSEREELKRVRVVERLVKKLIDDDKAAEILGLSTRQVLRLKSRYLEEGPDGLIHKNRGRKPSHALPGALKEKILSLYETKYFGSNDHHYAQLLGEHEGIEVSASTVRRILRAAGIPPTRKRRTRKIHYLRPRRQQAGELIQIDASIHNWLEDRGEPLALLAAIDDATNEIVAAIFRPTEDLYGYLSLMKQIIESKGVPLAIYTDCHTIFKSPKEKPTVEEELAGKDPSLSQFGQAVSELGIRHSKASCPQAKGRIERLWQTLQDRLIVELRLLNVNTLEQANSVLPGLINKHNSLFSVEAQNATEAYLPYEGSIELDKILCYREGVRKIGSGQSISVNGSTYRVQPIIPNKTLPAKALIDVRKTLDGQLFAYYQGEIMNLIKCNKSEKVAESRRVGKTCSPARKWSPPPDHPWRRFKIN